MIRTHKVKIYPNQTMLKVIERNFDYRRYIWNSGLEIWNNMYDAHLIFEDYQKPNEYFVRNELVNNKNDWQYGLSARILQQTVSSLANSWKNYFNPNMPDHDKPKFKSRKKSKQSFTTDRAKLINGKLRLDKPRGYDGVWYDIRLAEKVRFDGSLKVTTIVQNADGLYACLSVEVGDNLPSQGTKIGAVDVNIGHFTTPSDDVLTLPASLISLYKRITYCQKSLARKRVANPKRFNSNNYRKVRAKLNRYYQKITRVQEDILQKFTHNLATNYDIVGIEDLDVNHMKMNKNLSKNIHRSMFRKFRQIMEYKMSLYGKRLILVDRYFPSTQTCSRCGYIKTGSNKMTLNGDNKYHDHNTYRCYKCGMVMNRDRNAVQNLINETARLSA